MQKHVIFHYISKISSIRSDLDSAKNIFNSQNDSSEVNAIDIAKKALSNSISLVSGENITFEVEKVDNYEIEI